MQTNIEQYWTNHISRCEKHKSAMLQIPALSRRSLGEAKWSARPFCWTAAETTSRSACKASAEITRHTPLLVMQNVKMSKSHPTPTACRHCRIYIKASKLLNDLPQPSPRTSELAQHWQQPQAPLLCRFWSDPQNRGHCHPPGLIGTPPKVMYTNSRKCYRYSIWWLFFLKPEGGLCIPHWKS